MVDSAVRAVRGRTSCSLSQTAKSSPAVGTPFRPTICTAMEGPASVTSPRLSLIERTCHTKHALTITHTLMPHISQTLQGAKYPTAPTAAFLALKHSLDNGRGHRTHMGNVIDLKKSIHPNSIRT